MSATVKYKGNTIANITTTSSKTLKTSGKYCEGDIIVENVQDGGITPSGTIDITENGTFDVTAFASALVNVSGGSTLEILDEGELTFLEDTNVLTIDFSVENPQYCMLVIKTQDHINNAMNYVVSVISTSASVGMIGAITYYTIRLNNVAMGNAFTSSVTSDSFTLDGTGKSAQRYFNGNYYWCLINMSWT